jgi:hypothetical protein
MYGYDYISLSSSQNEKCFRQICRQHQDTHFMSNNFSENHVACEIMWKNMAEPDMPQMTVQRLRIECWITMARYTQSRQVILLSPLQQWLHEFPSMLRYNVTYSACLALYSNCHLMIFPMEAHCYLRGISHSSCSIIETNVTIQMVTVPFRYKIQKFLPCSQKAASKIFQRRSFSDTIKSADFPTPYTH